MVQDISFCINTDNENYGGPRFFINALERMGLRDDSNSDIVLNLDSVHNKIFRNGRKCTVYIEGDQFLQRGKNKDFYRRSDLLYIGDNRYKKYYPAKAKILTAGIDIDYHYPRNIEKIYDYVFIGQLEGNKVYKRRKLVLDKIKNSKFNVLITEGNIDTYCEDLSSGRVILNILPRKGRSNCLNMRVFEGMAIGTLMTDDNKLFKELGFVKNFHYLPLQRFGENFSNKELERIHKAGSEYVLKNFTYQKAIKQIIKDVKDFLK